MIGATHRALGWVLLLLVVVGSGCRTLSQDIVGDPGVHASTSTSAAADAESDGARRGSRLLLLPAEALPETFVLRQTVTVRWTDEAGQADTASFDAVIQRQGGSLLLLGLGPMGRVGFTLSLVKGKISFENRTGRNLPFDPERMLADVQRVYYPWLDATPECGDCVRTGRRGGFAIEEHHEQGRITRRRFVPLAKSAMGAGEAGGIEVLYSGEPAFGGVLRDARLLHEGFGYEIELETLHIDWID